MSKQRIYTIFLLLASAGYTWLYFNYRQGAENENHFTPCLFKNITGIPCPSCGITRSLILLSHGDFGGALYLNPLAIVAAIALISFPVWILVDIILKKSSFLRFYQTMECYFRKRWVAIPAILTILIIWITNISKNL